MRGAQYAKHHIWACDFETTTQPNLERDGYVRVWLWCAINVQTRERRTGNSIESFMASMMTKRTLLFFHNLKFDGVFIADWCLKHDRPIDPIIDGKGQAWYRLVVGDTEIRDSYQKFPTSLQVLAKDLGIAGKRDKPDFSRYFPEGYIPTPDEVDYCFQDCEIVRYAIEKEYDAGRMRLTVTAEAFHNLRESIGEQRFKKLFPPLSIWEDEFVRAAYAGGISFVNPKYQCATLRDIWVADINSSYPARMAYCLMPYGYGWFNARPKEGQVYVVRFTTEFVVKEDHLPFIQSVRMLRYNNGEDRFIEQSEGPTELTLTSVDYELFHEQYDVLYERDHVYMCYDAAVGICAPFIEANMAAKAQASREGNAYQRSVAKGNMNRSYGRFGINPNSLRASLVLNDEKDRVGISVEPEQRASQYVPYAAFVTAYARQALIHAIQANWDDFVYCDTDSIHCLKKPVGIEYHPTDLGKWDLECWKGYETYPYGKYLRAKCYCHADENKEIFKRYDEDYGLWDVEIRAAGIPMEAKLTLDWDTFEPGHVVTGKLQHSVVPGGVCLRPVTYTI